METESDHVIPTLSQVVGQASAVNVLRTAIDAYFYERAKVGDAQAFPHTLITGPAGCGKTLLSELIGREVCCANHFTELAQNVRSPQHVHASLMMLEPGDILFYDEIHELPSAAQVTLYRALEERKLFLGKRHVVTLPPFTLVGATTHEFLLSKSCRDRFRINVRVSHYSDQDMVLLVRQRAKRLGWIIDDEAVAAIGRRSRGVPRLAVRLLEATKRQASAEGTEVMTAAHVEKMCQIEAIDELGLDATEQQYLRLLRAEDSPIRLNVLATHLGLPRQSIEMLENDFIRLGLISKSDKGRMLTPRGIEHLAAKAK